MPTLGILVNFDLFFSFTHAGFRPGSRSTFLSGKVAKTIDAQSGQIRWDGRKGRADQLARLKQGPQDEQERPPLRPD